MRELEVLTGLVLAATVLAAVARRVGAPYPAFLALGGATLAFVPGAAVRHSHERSIRYELHRTYLVHQQLQAIFGLVTVPTIGSLFRAVATAVPANTRIAVREPAHRLRAVARGAALGVAQPLGQYLGARSSREQRELLHPTGI